MRLYLPEHQKMRPLGLTNMTDCPDMSRTRTTTVMPNGSGETGETRQQASVSKSVMKKVERTVVFLNLRQQIREKAINSDPLSSAEV